jgi:hypothetical protein
MGAGLQELYPQQNKDTLDSYSEQLFDFEILPVPSNFKFLIVAWRLLSW